MPVVDITVDCPVFDSFRVQQVAGMFDVPLAAKAAERFRVGSAGGIAEYREWTANSGQGTGMVQGNAVPCSPSAVPSSQWQIGLIVGPSGSGKSTLAKKLFGKCLYQRDSWPSDRAVIDGLGDLPIKQVTGMFTAVGFSSPPSWIKPYHVLSNGEQFRCDLARALSRAGNEAGDWRPESGASGRVPLAEPVPPAPAFAAQPVRRVVAFDEFTSVVDRNVARVISAAMAKGIHSGRIGCRFVAVTCHYDVTEWLEPDWVIDMASASFQWRRLRRPPIELEVVRCRRSAWRLFAPSLFKPALSSYARCYMALWRGVPVAFCATLSLLGRKNRRRISRIVTLPDYQGIGIGMALAETVAELNRLEGFRMNITASHPAVMHIAGARPCGGRWG